MGEGTRGEEGWVGVGSVKNGSVVAGVQGGWGCLPLHFFWSSLVSLEAAYLQRILKKLQIPLSSVFQPKRVLGLKLQRQAKTSNSLKHGGRFSPFFQFPRAVVRGWRLDQAFFRRRRKPPGCDLRRVTKTMTLRHVTARCGHRGGHLTPTWPTTPT